MKKKICQYLSKVLEEMPEKELFNLVEIPLEEKMGDLAVPCFAMAKKMHYKKRWRLYLSFPGYCCNIVPERAISF